MQRIEKIFIILQKYSIIKCVRASRTTDCNIFLLLQSSALKQGFVLRGEQVLGHIKTAHTSVLLRNKVYFKNLIYKKIK